LISPRVSLQTILTKFGTIGAVSFGGGVVAYLQRMLVEDTKWLSADDFLATLEISQTMPGLNAVNMSVLVGDRLRGPLGSVVAAFGMCAPGAIFVFAIGYTATLIHRATPIGHAALAGVAAGAVGLLAATTVHTGKKQFAKPLDLAILLITFGAMTLVKVSLFVILLTLGPIAIFLYRPKAQPHA
jgi:chromate transporter